MVVMVPRALVVECDSTEVTAIGKIVLAGVIADVTVEGRINKCKPYLQLPPICMKITQYFGYSKLVFFLIDHCLVEIIKHIHHFCFIIFHFVKCPAYRTHICSVQYSLYILCIFFNCK